MNVSKISLHIETRKVLRPSEICVLQRSKPDELQISISGGETLRINVFHIHEFGLVWLQSSRLSAP
jgi:hypothetical protein